MNRKSICRIAWIVCLCVVPGTAWAGDYSGSFAGGKISAVIIADGANYRGEIHKGDQTFPLTAREDGDHLSGVFTASGNSFEFTATKQNDDLTLSTGGAAYQLHRNSNPLDVASDPAAPKQAAAGDVHGGDALAGYVVMNQTDVGRSLVRELANVTTTMAAMQVAFPDLEKFFGARPTILGGYEDQRDHQSAFASFTAQLNGQPVKGFVTVKLREKGAVVFVVFGKSSATAAEWSALTARPTVADKPAANGGGDMKAQMAAVPLKPYAFPDRTGAVGLAEGWTTNAQTESNLIINGPAGQKIRMAFGGTMYTPDNLMVRQGAGNLPVAKYSDDPATALGNIIRANSIVSQRQGGPTITPDKVIKVVPVPARNPGGHGAQITYDATVTDQQGPKKVRVLVQFEIMPGRNSIWQYYVSLQLMSPRETFEQDLPVMLAQAFSLNENPDAIAAKSAREINAANQHAAAMRAANQKVADANYARTQSVEDNETVKMRSLTDFDEVIRGERTIEDTQTGEQTSVNLADVHDIVDRLNNQDPDRYKEIPLRDQFFPSAAHVNDPDYIPR